jgi:glycosyltransferase involved in cell wall biosynthesis
VISVVVPNYNSCQFVENAIVSLVSQTYGDFEIIVVDDGSTDNSREVIMSFGSQVRYIWQENQGLASARNTGIRAARGELIGLLDADDQWRPHFLERMAALADLHPEASVYYCCAQGMDAAGRDLPEIFGGPIVQPSKLYHMLLRANFLIPSTLVLRRSHVQEAGLFDQNLRSCEDWDLWLRLLPESVFVGTSECLVRYRLHDASLSKDLAGMHQAAKAVITKNFGVNDGQWNNWSAEKRRAYGGLYRYFALTNIQYRADWRSGVRYLFKALQVDPELADDLDLYYALALGSNLLDIVAVLSGWDLLGNVTRFNDLVRDASASITDQALKQTVRRALGIASYAFGLVAYNTGQIALSRHLLLKALFLRPGLLRNRSVGASLMRSFLGKRMI